MTQGAGSVSIIHLRSVLLMVMAALGTDFPALVG